MRQFVVRLVLCLCIAAALVGQTRLRLKNAWEPASAVTEEGEPSAAKSWSGDRVHVFVEFGEETDFQKIPNLGGEDVRVVEYVPDRGLVLSVPLDSARKLLEKRHAGPMPAISKISPMFDAEGYQSTRLELVVEFYRDVDPETARAIAEAQGFEVLEHPDLMTNHLLLTGRAQDVGQLAAWDEVAYLFPASAELASGERLLACAGAITELGPVGQYVATVGDGWDGPGQGRAELGYYFQALTQKLPEAEVRSEILRALAEWARVAGVSFSPAASPRSARTLNILFGSGNHGDPYPFDGPGRVLAHTFYPAPPNPEPIAGDMHLDGDEEWVIGPGLTARSVDVFSVSLHEAGHALGLGHSDLPGSVMYPYYRRATALTQEDTNAIRQIYAPPGGSVTPEPPGPPPAAPTIAIVSPTSGTSYSTPAASITLSGTASPAGGIARVRWSNSRGGSGLASGTAQWLAGPVSLQPGDNTLTLAVDDNTGAFASKTLTVNCVAPAHTTAPTLKITSPASTSILTASSTVRLQGTAFDSAGVAEVTWSTSYGASGQAAGTSYWVAADIPLLVGANVVIVRARDTAGNTSWRSVTVTRR